jgi:outer membrane lipoprotein-sorting protein
MIKIIVIFFIFVNFSYSKENIEIADYEKYLNSINTIEANFLQDDISNNSLSEGVLYVSRPGKMRLEYKIPIELAIFVNNNIITYYDKELEEVSNVPLSTTPLKFLLEREIFFNKNGNEVIDTKRNKNNISISIIEKAKENDGMLKLIFTEKPIELKEINLVNELGQEINIKLINAKFNKGIKKSIFNFINPRLKRNI